MQAHEPSPASSATKRKVLVVDDHPVVREGLAKRLNDESDLNMCGEAQNADEALRAISQCQPDVVVLDLALRDRHGLELIKDIRTRHNSLPIVVFTMFDESTYGPRALKAGAQGYVMKQESSERLLSAIRAVLNGGYAMSPQASSRFLQSVLQTSAKPATSPVETLADRELEVFELLGKGVGTREIAARLGLSIKTIETYRTRIKEKLHLTSATALVREAVRWVESR